MLSEKEEGNGNFLIANNEEKISNSSSPFENEKLQR